MRDRSANDEGHPNDEERRFRRGRKTRAAALRSTCSHPSMRYLDLIVLYFVIRHWF